MKSPITYGLTLLLILAPSLSLKGADTSTLIQNLEAGKQQTVVTFGTSLTAVGAWVDQLAVSLEQAYPGQAKVINGAQGGANSDWGIKNIEEKVLKHQPDTVLIEFSVNDAVGQRKTTVEHAKANLNSMIDQLLAQNEQCEIILQVMNPAVGHTSTRRPQLAEFNQMYRDVAKERDLQLIDHYPNWQRVLDETPLTFLAYVPDTIHPMRDGALNVITPHLFAEIGLTKPTRPEKSVDTPCWKYLLHVMRTDKKSPDTNKADFDAYWLTGFTKSDLDGNGSLNAAEIASPALLAKLDTDKNGTVEQAEWTGSFPDLFSAFDRNGDQVISQLEKTRLVLPLSDSPDSLAPYTDASQLPKDAREMWGSYDPRAEDLDVKVHGEWEADGVVSRLITFKVGTFKGVDSRISAYYCFPKNGQKNPAFVWSHGGGQRADRNRGHYFGTQGFATVDINWLGRPLENDTQDLTDWGKIDPTQGPGFYKKALRKHFKSDFQPDKHSVDPIMSPRNSNWFMLALAGRRALTFLEQQPEVDAERLGFTGFSMGGTITSMTSIDPRLKAVAPFVGGTAYLWENYAGMQTGGVIRNIKDIELYQNTIDPAAYWPHVEIPVLFITSSNDFHSAQERIYRSMDMLPHDEWRVTGNVHANHGPGPEQWVVLNHWFHQYLGGKEQNIPATPPSTFSIEGNTASFAVTPEQPERLQVVEIYYSYDPNSVARFWRRAEQVEKANNTWTAQIPVHAQLPLYTYALCRYQLDAEQPLERGSTKTFVLCSDDHTHIPSDIDLAQYQSLPKTGLVDDFANGMQNWSSRNGSSYKTYKFQDPELDTSGAKLAVTLNLKADQPILFGIGTDSKFLGGGRDQGNFHHGRRLDGDGETTVLLSPSDFKSKDEKTIEWSKISTFTITLTDANTRQGLDLSAPEHASLLKRIELVAGE